MKKMSVVIFVMVLMSVFTACLPKPPATVIVNGVQIQVEVQAVATKMCIENNSDKRGIVEKILEELAKGLRHWENVTSSTVSYNRGYYEIMMHSSLLRGSSLLEFTGASNMKAIHEALRWASVEYEQGEYMNRYKVHENPEELPKDCE